MTEYPWEPPLAGTEVEQLTGSLDRLARPGRAVPRRQLTAPTTSALIRPGSL